MKRIAVIGGGIFGSTAAIYAARAGYEVHLFEEQADLLQAASGINQYRLHRGYHYPRSPETARAAIEGEKTFREEYGEAVMDGGRHLYAIAREGSKVNAAHCRTFFGAHALPYEEVAVSKEIADPESLEAIFKVSESWIDPHRLRALAKQKLAAAGVEVHAGTRVALSDTASFEWVVLATYANLNALIPEEFGTRQEYKFQVCEKPVIKLPSSFADTGIVVIDGPFTCVDPYGRTGLHVLGHVVHAVHVTNVGYLPEIPDALRPFLNRGVIERPLVTAWEKFVEDGSRFIPALAEAEHVGSLYTIRTVLPNLEKTDARPTVVSSFGNRYIRIFSGKIGNCVDAAREALGIIQNG